METSAKKIIQGLGICIDNCDNYSPYVNEYHGKCYENCESSKCLSCEQVDLTKSLCTKCNVGYYSNITNIGKYMNCFKDYIIDSTISTIYQYSTSNSINYTIDGNKTQKFITHYLQTTVIYECDIKDGLNDNCNFVNLKNYGEIYN